MNREEMLKNLTAQKEWDVIIIGGGATGLGAAVDSASRGFSTLLLEGHDFAKGTSSRSTKLIHGGLRYLQQGNISLVIEALHERGTLAQNAPHMIYHLPFLLPNYKWWEGPFYGIGLKVYDMLAGKLGIEKSRILSREETLKVIPTLEPQDLRGSTIYYDGQFDDARLSITLAQTAADQGATLLNYMPVTALSKTDGIVHSVKAKDLENNKTYTLKARSIINATGVFSDKVRKLDNAKHKKLIAPSRGTHIILPKKFLPSDTAMLIPHTEDERVIFVIPWHDRILLGTTDIPVKEPSFEPKPLASEITFLLKHASRYLINNPTKKDILSIFTGLRPLIKAGGASDTAALSRDHTVLIEPSGLITIAGGKWTTYRKMAEDVIDKAIEIGGLPHNPCTTKTLKLHGWKKVDPRKTLSAYGSDITKIRTLMKTKKNAKLIHPNLPYILAELIWAIDFEMARTVEDLLSRRTRSLLLDAKASIEIAPDVAALLAKKLKKPKSWEKSQITTFKKLAQGHLP